LRKLSNNGSKKVAAKPGRPHLIAIVAIAVTLAIVFAAVYVYTSEDGHEGYVPGDGEPLAPNFSLVDSEGATVSLAQYAGSVVILDFMSTSCQPCKDQIDNLKTIYGSYAARGVKIVSIDVDTTDSSPHLQSYKLERGASWPFVRDTAGVYIESEYSATSIPTVVIIDQAGHIVKRNVGVMSSAEIRSFLDPLLGG
jgi:peroxiredoxin